MRLADTQRVFWELVTRAPGAGAASEALGAVFAGSAELPAAERVEIYAEMFFARLADALRETFPKLAALIGADGWPDFVRDYLRAHPSEHPDIGRLGRRVEAFLRSHAAAGTLPRPDLAAMADLAALEWARDEVFDEAPAEPLPADALPALGPDAFAAARLEFVPALRLLALEFDVAPLWRHLDQGPPAARPFGDDPDAEPPEPRAGPASVLVWRKGFDVFHSSLDDAEALALARARECRPLAEVCDAFVARPDAAPAAFRALASWFGEGLVARIY
jgi:hypothetical protein